MLGLSEYRVDGFLRLEKNVPRLSYFPEKNRNSGINLFFKGTIKGITKGIAIETDTPMVVIMEGFIMKV